MPLDENVNEADFIGGYLGEPVDVVDCETVDLQVPATSEIVIEGTLSPTETAWEGPMGEYSGYLSPGGGMPSPIFQVSAMTYRERADPPGGGGRGAGRGEPHLLGPDRQRPDALGAALAGFPVTMCFCPFESAAHWLVVTVPASAGAGGTTKRS